jgi:AcrR family transcriptional regulator
VKARAPIKVNLAARAANAEIKRRQTRERLLEGALSVLAEKGAEAASIEDYASAAGVSRGTFYNYFLTTTELLDTLRRSLVEDASVRMTALLEPVADPPLRIAAMARFMIRNAVERPERGWALLHLSRLDDGVPPGWRALLSQALDDGAANGRLRTVDLDAAVTLLAGATRTAARDLLVGRPHEPHVTEVIAMMLCALGAAPDEAPALARLSTAVLPD